MVTLRELDKIVDAIKRELNKEFYNNGERVLLEIKVNINDIRFIEIECTPYGECEDYNFMTQEEIEHICLVDSKHITKYTSVDVHSIDLFNKEGDYVGSLKLKEIQFKN